MKVLALGKITHHKLCNLSPGIPFKQINPDLTLDPKIYMKINIPEHSTAAKYSGWCINIETGEFTNLHPSTKVQIFQDACIVLDPIDRD